MLSRQQVLPDSMPQFREANFPAMAQGACFSNEGHLPHFASHRLLPGKSQIQMGHPLNIHADVSGSDFSSDDDDDDDEEDEQFQSIDMNALRQRGKGVYYCPKGVKCDKGGVDKDGNLVVFDRNSSFACVFSFFFTFFVSCIRRASLLSAKARISIVTPPVNRIASESQNGDGRVVEIDANQMCYAIGSIATNTANHGDATYLDARTLRRKGDSLDGTVWRGTRPRLSITC